MLDFEYLKANRIVVYCETDEDVARLHEAAEAAMEDIPPVRSGGSYFRFFPFSKPEDAVRGRYGWSKNPDLYAKDGMLIRSFAELSSTESDEVDMTDALEILGII